MYTMKKQIKEENARKKRTENAGVGSLQEFYANLKKAVADTGVSAWALEKKFGWHKQFLSNILRGDRDPKFSSIVRIVKSMHLSVDGLLGGGFQTETVHPQSVPLDQTVPVPSGTEIKKISIGFAEKVARMHENDVELLEAIAGILIERKSRAMARFLHAVQDTGQGNPGGKGTLSGGVDSGKPDGSFRDRFGNAREDGDTDFGECEDFDDDDDFDFGDDDFKLDDDYDDFDFDEDDDDEDFFDD